MINVVIQENDTFFKRGLAEVFTHAFETKYQRSVTFYDVLEADTIAFMDIIVLEIYPGDNVDCHSLLKHRKKRSLVIGFYDGDDLVKNQRPPLCLKNMLYINKRNSIQKIRNDIIFAWNEHATGNDEWVKPDCSMCSRMQLSRQQERIALFTVKGFNNRQIANLMNINAKTVSAHKHCIMEKFNIDNNADLVHFLRRKIIHIWSSDRIAAL